MKYNRRGFVVDNFKAQQGWTFWSLLFTMSVLMFFAYVGMQLVPVYSANKNVQNAMQIAIDEVDVRRASKASIIKTMNAQLYLDGDHKMLNYKEDLKVQRSRKNLIVQVKYSVEIPLFFNLAILAKFDNTVERKLT